jgi:hypothetical protein
MASEDRVLLEKKKWNAGIIFFSYAFPSWINYIIAGNSEVGKDQLPVRDIIRDELPRHQKHSFM